MTFQEAKEHLERVRGDDERFHGLFDDLIEARLDELDPEFMKAMRDYYNETGMGRWCA